MAEKVSDEIFSVPGWEKVGAVNQNWKCVNQENHETKQGTHPSDVVFRSQDPLSNYIIYVNVDLKSYAVNSIMKTAVTIALDSLADSTNCANTSDEWADRYTRPEELRRTYGLLFIYNHDDEYHKDFDDILEKPTSIVCC